MQSLVLNNGVRMPVLGFGVYQISNDTQCRQSVEQALALGYRSIDTAQAYQNETAVGTAIRNSSVPRDQIFVTTKIWVSSTGEEKCKKSIEESLERLQTDYIDLLLIHQPYGDYYGAWRAMEQALKEGKCRAIGVSNFFADRLVDLCNFVDVLPQVNQMEMHVYQQQAELKPYLDKFRVQLESWSPFAAGRNALFKDMLLNKIGARYHKSAAQIALRFLIQSGVIAIPKSVHPSRMEENLNIFDFELSFADMDLIRGLDTGRSLFCDHSDPEFVQLIVGYKR